LGTSDSIGGGSFVRLVSEQWNKNLTRYFFFAHTRAGATGALNAWPEIFASLYGMKIGNSYFAGETNSG
jgi:hypothetical protein